ncbi:hypothetical protein C8R44DRAFT_847812 [Mycena epipterygia]|nr:hypothetical protein C8R44DRAFT_847812 [Mycena epipterygia]
MPQFNILSPLFRTKSKSEAKGFSNAGHEHEFLVFGVPEDKYGHHTVLVHHPPTNTFRKVVAVFGRMQEDIAKAQLLGEIRMRKPYAWEELEQVANPPNQLQRAGKPPIDIYITGLDCAAESTFGKLEEYARRQDLRRGDGENVVPVAVYLAKVTTNRSQLLYDGPESNLPEGYLTFYTAR